LGTPRPPTSWPTRPYWSPSWSSRSIPSSPQRPVATSGVPRRPRVDARLPGMARKGSWAEFGLWSAPCSAPSERLPLRRTPM
jgi:hypothetical protein